METDPVDAQSALDAVAAAERRSAQIATSPPWYAPWYGVTCGTLTFGFSLYGPRQTAAFVVLAIAFASLGLLVSAFRRTTGVWPSSKGLLRYLISAGMVLIIGSALGFAAITVSGAWWPGLPVAAVVAVAATWLSQAFDVAYASLHGSR